MADAIIKIQVRRDTLANWEAENPVLLQGEIGFITDENYFVIGNGVDQFITLYSLVLFIPKSFIEGLLTLLSNNLTALIDAEELARQIGDNVQAANLAIETQARIDADQYFAGVAAGLIADEANQRAAEDLTLQGNIDAEAATRAADDLILQGNIDAKQDEITPATVADYFRGDKTMQPLDKTAVGLGNVDNTSDSNKPVSTPQQAAINKLRDVFYYRRPTSWHTPSISPTHQGVAVSANTIFFQPFVVIDTLTITDIGYNVSAVGTTTLARCGIYSSDANNQPSVLLADSGNLGVSLGSKSVTLGSPIVLSAGLYWTAYLQNGTGSVTGCNNLAIPNIFGNSTIAATGINAYSKAVTYGALPNPVSALTNSSGAIPFAYFKIT